MTPTKPKVNLPKADDFNDIIVAVISQVNIVVNVKECMVNLGATRQIYKNKMLILHHSSRARRRNTYLDDSRTTQVLKNGN